MNISIAQAKSQFSELVKRVESGEEIVITRHGKPVVNMTPAHSKPENAPSLIGALEGKVWIAEDFDTLGPEWDEYVR
jgi:prevent-host-death family protein